MEGRVNGHRALIEDGQERIILYRSVMAELPNLLIAVALVAGAYLFIKEFPSSIVRFSFGSYAGAAPLPYLVPLIYILFVAHRLYDCRYMITDRYVRAIEGVLGVKKKDRFIEFHNIRAIEIDRGLLQRFINIGDLRISSASYSNVEIQFRGIFNPSKYRDVIMARTRVEIRDLYDLTKTGKRVANGSGHFPVMENSKEEHDIYFGN